MEMLSSEYSVLMSVFHKEVPEFFKMSIESMLNQTLKPNEIVIVKDGELTEELNEIINSYANAEPELFTIVSLKKNVGLGRALNEGLKKCRNELVARMDTDDISLKERCELQVNEFMKNDKLSIVGTMIDEFHNDPTDIVSSRIVPVEHKDILRFSRRRNPFNHPTVMYKKSAVLSFGGYGDFRRNQDLDLFVRMLNNGHFAININKSLLLFRANQDNLQRRKSWEKCRSYIYMVFEFWRMGYSTLFDLIFVTVSQITILIAPAWFLKWLSSRFLRKNNKKVVR